MQKGLEALGEFIEQNVVNSVPLEEVGKAFYSHVFMVQKPSGKFRLILNLKPLNLSVNYKRFRMDYIFSVKVLLPPNCYMASLDLKIVFL